MNHAKGRSMVIVRLFAAMLVLTPIAITALVVRAADAQAPGSADLRLTKSDSPDPVTTNGKLTYTIAVRNLGPGTATNTVVTDRLPNSVQFLTVESSQGKCALRKRKLTCSLGDIGFGEQYDPTATITVLVRAPEKAGKVSNTATVTSDTNDPYGKSDSDTEQTTVQAGPVPTCRGEVATIVGSRREDVLRGTSGRDVIQTRAGDDAVRGLAGRDLICAGTGDDTVRGGAGNDKAFGAGGRDGIGGQSGDDVLKGNAGRDRLKGGRGDDTLRGGSGNDRCHGGAGDDTAGSC
jgi:uncharacterized repeat protein (TIGR01451 family)